MKAFDKAASYRGNASFSTWLFSIVVNHCLDYVRKQRKYSQQAFTNGIDLEDEATDLETELEIEQQRLALEAMLEQLTDSEREMLLSKYLHNQSIEDLGQRWGLKGSAVKMRLKRTREKLLSMYSTWPGPGTSPMAA